MHRTRVFFFCCILPIKKLSPSSNGYCQVILPAEENYKTCIYKSACSQFCTVSTGLRSPKAETHIRHCHISLQCPLCWQLQEEGRETGIGNVLAYQGGSLHSGFVVYLQGFLLNHIKSFFCLPSAWDHRWLHENLSLGRLHIPPALQAHQAVAINRRIQLLYTPCIKPETLYHGRVLHFHLLFICLHLKGLHSASSKFFSQNPRSPHS